MSTMSSQTPPTLFETQRRLYKKRRTDLGQTREHKNGAVSTG